MKRNFGSRLRRAFERKAGPRDLLRRHHERLRPDVVDEIELPPGDVIENDRGSCYVRRLHYPLDQLHGRLCLGAARDADHERLAELAKVPAAADVDLSSCLFLDTETTGLSGGAGTVVFMVGIGFFAVDEFVLEQTFLRSYGEEPAALVHTANRLREHPFLVTFVGKSFDRHRLAARMAVHRVRSRVMSSQHMDLYWMARRAWQHELPDVRLQTVEREKLDFHRADDMPGAEAPMAFLDWIRDRSGRIDRVFEHNRLDVLSLVTLLAALGASVD